MEHNCRSSLMNIIINKRLTKTHCIYCNHGNQIDRLHVHSTDNGYSNNNTKSTLISTNHSFSNNSGKCTYYSQKLRIFVSILASFSCLVKSSAAFGQGSSIVANFEQTYCQSRVNSLNRAPNHNDPSACGGTCSPRPAPRGLYSISVNTTVYSIHSVQVVISANVGANILGFAVVAISERNRTAGRWLVQQDPDVVRATCDSLLEGQVIFHARSSNDRRRVVITWDARRTNFGRIYFRAWIVQRHSVIYVVDSEPLTNPLNGSAFISVEDRLTDIVSTLRTQRGTISSARQPPVLTQPSRFISTLTSRNGTTFTNIDQHSIAEDSAKGSRNSTKDTLLHGSTNLTKVGAPEMLVVPPVTLKRFEEAFHSRLLSGYNLSGGDPLAEFRRERYLLVDFLPELPSQRVTNTLADPFRNGQFPGQTQGQFPGQQGQFPGQTQGQFPGQPQGQFPGQQQGQFPGQQQGQFPGQQQGQFPGQHQGQFPGQQQGQFPGQQQGQFPGQQQGQFPGQQQGQFPGQQQGQFPGQQQGQFPGQHQGQSQGQFPWQQQVTGQSQGQFPWQQQFPGQSQGQFPWQQQGQSQGQFPWQQQFPGQSQGQFPWQQQGQSQGQFPWQQQGQSQGQFPWQQQFPGQSQGQFPWQQQGQSQGQFPWQQQVTGQSQGQFPWQQQGRFPWQSQSQFLGQSQNQFSSQMLQQQNMNSNFGTTGTPLASNNPSFGMNNFQNPAQLPSWTPPWNIAGSFGVPGSAPFQNGGSSPDMQFQMMNFAMNGRSNSMANPNGASQMGQVAGGQSWSNIGNGQNRPEGFADRAQMFGR